MVQPKSKEIRLALELQRLASKIPPLTEMLRGTLRKRYVRCGKSGCHCKKGRGHGPIAYLSVTLRGGVTKHPLVKTIRRHFGQEAALYGGRKGFTDLMLNRNQSLEHIAQWMGHSSIERTWRHYKSRHTYHYHLNGIMACSTWTPSKIVATG